MKSRCSNKYGKTCFRKVLLNNYVTDHEKLNASVDYPVCKDMKSTSDEIEERIFIVNKIVSLLL